MRRGRIFLFIALILILLLVGVVYVYVTFMGGTPTADNPVAQAATPTPVAYVNVIFAAQRIPRGTAITAEQIREVPWPKEQVIEGLITNSADVTGRLARFDLDQGIPLTTNMVVDSAGELSRTGSTAALQIPRGMVAVSIPIDRLTSVAFAPQPGDHVNVIMTMAMVDLDTDFQTILPNNTSAVLESGPGVLIASGTEDDASVAVDAELEKLTAQSASGGVAAPYGRAEVDPILGQTFYLVPSEDQRPRLVSQALLQDAIVLRMGDFPLNPDEETKPTPTPAPAGEGETGTTEGTGEGEILQKELPPDIVTLIVSPQDAITLNYLMFTGGKMTLALRSANDDTRIATEAVTLQFLLDQYNIPVPIKLPYGMNPAVEGAEVPVLSNDLVPTPEP